MKNKEVEQRANELKQSMNKYRSDNGYFPLDENRVMAIGWLDITEPFEKGEVPKDFLDKLKVLWHNGPFKQNGSFVYQER